MPKTISQHELERRRKISETLKRKHEEGEIKSWDEGLTKETDVRLLKSGRKISKSMKGKNTYSRDITHWTEDGLQKLRETGKKNSKYLTNLTEEQLLKREIKRIKILKEREQTQDEKIQRVESNRKTRLERYGTWHSSDARKNIGISNTGKGGKNKSNAQKKVWDDYTQDAKNKRLKKSFKSWDRAKNDVEIFTDILIQKARPTDFIYSGDGKIFIAGKVPDWFNVNGKKQVIELFGNYWHGVDYRQKYYNDFKTNEEHELERINHFKKYGYDCLIIWEHELKNPDKVIDKIRNF